MKFHFKYILISILFVLSLSISSMAEGIKWYDYQTGIKAAKEKNKKVYLYFYSDRCPWCHRMAESTLASAKVVSYLNRFFIPVKINVSNEMDLVTKYHIGPIPSNIFLESDIDTKIYTRLGYVEEPAFMNILEGIALEKYKE